MFGLPLDAKRKGALASVDRMVLVHRLREVVTQIGFTRFESSALPIDSEVDLGVRLAALALETRWLPAIENRGEGVFLALDAERVRAWTTRPAVKQRALEFQGGVQSIWKNPVPLERVEQIYMPYIMLHSLSHLLLTAIALECGYAAASIRERIYVRDGAYGLLLYTGTPDAEGRITAGANFDPLNASASVTVAAYARQWIEERRRLVADAGNDEARLKYHILPAIGGLLLEEVRPRHLVEMILALRNSGKLAPKSIAGAEVPEFALDLDMEWLRAAEGHTERSDCNVVAGGDSLHLRGWKRPLADLPRACADFLAIFNRGVPEAFQFADSVKPIHESDPLHQKLEADLYAAMQLRYFEVMSVGVDAKIAHAASEYFILYDRQRWEIAGLDDDSLMRGLDQVHAYQENFHPERVLLLLLDAEGDQVLRGRLDHLIQMEIDRDGDTYVRIERRWFRCREDYIRRVNERVAALDDITAVLLLPVWDKTAHPPEENYNDHTAATKGWLLQDQVFWYRGDERIEPCDLLTPDCHSFTSRTEPHRRH